jgi:hypothetical protein
LKGYPKEAAGNILGKDIAWWFMNDPPWPELVEEVFVFDGVQSFIEEFWA